MTRFRFLLNGRTLAVCDTTVHQVIEMQHAWEATVQRCRPGERVAAMVAQDNLIYILRINNRRNERCIT